MLVTAPLMLLSTAPATLMAAPSNTLTTAPVTGITALSDTLAGLEWRNSPARALELIRTYLVYLGIHVDLAKKLNFLKTLLSTRTVGDKLSILCNQENLILKANTYKHFQATLGFQFFVNQAVKSV